MTDAPVFALDLGHDECYNVCMKSGTTVREADISEILGSIVHLIRRHLSKDYRVLLFGSWAASKALPTSDIDIAISGLRRAEDITMARLRADLDDLPTLRKIDVIDLSEVDPRFRENVLSQARVLD